ncbi:MAG: hypothetical protein NTV97_25680, partial [Alphaproteobacteria bacterium]|nr:hypothetical protein [Alphaproteobacteria bacterium]
EAVGAPHLLFTSKLVAAPYLSLSCGCPCYGSPCGCNQKTTSTMSTDLTYHFPPELFGLLVDTIPLLNRSKRDVITFFRGAGAPSDITDGLTARLKEDRNSVNKYEMVRVVLDRLNSRGEATLRERREVVRRVVEFTNFDVCWPTDQLSARGLVASIREVVNQKDAFT